ncbi:MAG: hypothetical protein ACLFPD_11110 [Desulfosudaceae bacterium]
MFWTAPFLLVMTAVLIFLWSYSFLPALALLFFYLAMCWFQAYCCVYQDCPYVGGFCPAIVGILPASFLARFLYRRRPVVKSPEKFNRRAMLATLCWLGIIGLPLYWLYLNSVVLAAGYVIFHAVYFVVFALTICPVCAIRNTCPGGMLQRLVFKN